MHEHHIQELQESIEATGRGVIKVRPDLALVRLGVVVTAKKPETAIAENAERMSAVINAIRKLGVPESAIQTVGFNVQPIYEWDEENKKSVLSGYRATNGVSVRASIEQAGEIYDTGVNAGANEAGGITFTLKDDSKARRDALIQATKLAMDEIQIVATALGVGLRGPLHAEVLENGVDRPIELGFRAGDVGTTPVLPGQVEVAQSVRLVFGLKDQ